ncbi:zinc finger CW-type PWWP domain protein 1 [Mastomys coucha]|uniref:zinc finger CW-type PWWP domain protein 1 n=1 Tax=Mastomys coucha TaxID=35658 RepID=UPI001261F258|nr:zinc finger CW-type PWWP domain protein 1 [Mastomys coucha]
MGLVGFRSEDGAGLLPLRSRKIGFQLRMRVASERKPLGGGNNNNNNNKKELSVVAGSEARGTTRLSGSEGGEASTRSGILGTEYEKGTKKTFAPPTQKLHSEKPQPNSWNEDIPGTSSPEAETKPSLFKASLKKGQKTTTEHGPSRGQESHCVIWVQCSSPKCEKWRQLRGNIDPSVLPDDWSCDQNPDLNYNRCDIPEESWAGCESDVAYASYVPGSIIWAKQYGYPWWPGMIESDPDMGEYFLFASHLDSLPSKYHVTFFGETVSRAWIPVRMLKNFQELSLELAKVKKCKNKDSNQKLEAAIAMAHRAEQISIQERVNLFGFWSRYSGADISGEGKDLMLCESNNPESCPEKEEKDSEEEQEEKEEKKDPTLPRSKPARMQTKKPKSRGPAGGQDGTPKEKTVKKSLVSESTVPPVPTLRGKEEQGNSDLDYPGKPQRLKGCISPPRVISEKLNKPSCFCVEVL